jgi:hypothetical protein
MGDPQADRLLDAIRANGDRGMTRNEVVDFFKRNLPKLRIERMISSLEEKQLIRRGAEKTAGRPVERYFGTR